MNVLVCEDNMLTQKAIELSLKKEGYHVFNAGDGFQGIKILGEEKIDLVITDINMPRLDGIEMLKQMKMAGTGSG